MSTSQDGIWKSKEQAEEAKYAHEKEQAQLATLREQMKKTADETSTIAATSASTGHLDHDFEGGFGGQEDLEDRYATTSGEH